MDTTVYEITCDKCKKQLLYHVNKTERSDLDEFQAKQLHKDHELFCDGIKEETS